MAETKSKWILVSMLKGIFTSIKTFITKAIDDAKPGVATAAKAGLVKAGGTGINIDANGVISATGEADVNPEALPLASTEKRGAVIIGSGINMDAEGKITVVHPTRLSEFTNDSSFATTAEVTAAAKKAADTAKAELIGGAPETYDTLKEVADYISQHKDVETALNDAIGTKANKEDVLLKSDYEVATQEEIDAILTEVFGDVA